MKLPTFFHFSNRRACLSAPHLKSALPPRSKTPVVYTHPKGCGSMLIGHVPGGIALNYLLNHADDAHEVSAGLSWAKGRRAAYTRPRCERSARTIYLHPYRCAYCFKVDEAVSKAIHITATTPQSSGARAIQKRHSQMTREEVDAEINAVLKALREGAPDGEALN